MDSSECSNSLAIKKKKRKETLNDILLFGYKLYTHTRARQVSRE